MTKRTNASKTTGKTRGREWFETFFEGMYGKLLSSGRGELIAAKEALLIRKLLRLRKGQSVLDVPCGFGRISRALAGMGLRLTGVDLASSYIREARRRATKAGLKVDFYQGDMRELEYRGQFDAAVNWFTSFGYFHESENLDVARRLRQALRPGGRLLIDTLNKTWLLAHFKALIEETTPNGVYIRNTASYDPRKSIVRSVWTFRKGSKTERKRTRIVIYSGPELRCLLRAAGFTDIRLYGHRPLGRLTRYSKRLIAVARRPLDENH